jgi:hypothetical protein
MTKATGDPPVKRRRFVQTVVRDGLTAMATFWSMGTAALLGKMADVA